MNMMLPWTQNQTLTLQEQLDRGVQWLDFRLSYSPSSGEVYLSHSLLTEHRFVDILQQLVRRCEDRQEEHPLLYIHLRVDFRDRSHASVIGPILSFILRTVEPYLCVRGMCSATLQETSRNQKNKLLFYCADGTIQDPRIFSLDLAPSVSFWDAGDNMESRLSQMPEQFQAQADGPFLFPRDRMIVFDYSSTAPLWWTDREQFALIKRYKDTILRAQPSILAGNHVEELMQLFAA